MGIVSTVIGISPDSLPPSYRYKKESSWEFSCPVVGITQHPDRPDSSYEVRIWRLGDYGNLPSKQDRFDIAFLGANVSLEEVLREFSGQLNSGRSALFNTPYDFLNAVVEHLRSLITTDDIRPLEKAYLAILEIIN